MTRTNSFVSAAAGCLALLAGAGLTVSAHAADVNDSQLADRVQGKLAVDDAAIARLVQVSAKDGVVTLSGTAYTGQQALKALKDAESVAGVVKVQNHLAVQQ
jgi:osmotically-inducible protein OsmY